MRRYRRNEWLHSDDDRDRSRFDRLIEEVLHRQLDVNRQTAAPQEALTQDPNETSSRRAVLRHFGRTVLTVVAIESLKGSDDGLDAFTLNLSFMTEKRAGARVVSRPGKGCCG